MMTWSFWLQTIGLQNAKLIIKKNVYRKWNINIIGVIERMLMISTIHDDYPWTPTTNCFLNRFYGVIALQNVDLISLHSYNQIWIYKKHFIFCLFVFYEYLFYLNDTEFKDTRIAINYCKLHKNNSLIFTQ